MEIRGPRNIGQIRPVGPTSPRANQPAKEPVSPDRQDTAQISEQAMLTSRVLGVADIRADKVADVRKAIQDGTYVTPEKIEATIDKIVEQ